MIVKNLYNLKNYLSNQNPQNECNIVQNYNISATSLPDSLSGLNWGIYPKSKAYNDSRLNYNKLQNYYPTALLYPRNETEASYAITELVGNSINFAIRCGGRAYEPASLTNQVVIDVSLLKSIVVDKKKMTVKIGSGVTLGELVNELAKYKFIVSCGDSSCVGSMGYYLAGGKGYLTRILGMGAQNIISAQMINHKGKLICASSKENSELLYALKGSGHGSYGLITSLELKIYKDVYCQMVKLTWEWNKSQVFELIEFYQKWIKTQPKEITTDLNMTYSQSSNSASFYILFIKYSAKPCPIETFTEYKGFTDLNPNVTIEINEGYYTKMLDKLVSGNSGNSYVYSKIKSTMVFDKINDCGVKLMIDSVNQMVKNKSPFQYQINFTQLGGKVESKSLTKSSSYFPSNAKFVITILNAWNDPKYNDEGKMIPNNLYNKLVPFTSKYCLPNMIDYDLPDYMINYYGNNANKLKKVKNEYDPNNVFNWFQSVK